MGKEAYPGCCFMELLLNELSGDGGSLVCTRPPVSAVGSVCHNSGVRRSLPPGERLLASFFAHPPLSLPLVS